MIGAIAAFVIGFVWLVTTFVISGIHADFACEKGYDWYKAFWLCFFLGLPGCFLVAARPDLNAREKVKSLELAETVQ